MSPIPASDRREAGYALITAVWMLLIIAVLASAVSLSALRENMAVRDFAEDLDRRYLLESALATVLMNRMAEGRRSELYELPADTELVIGEQQIRVRLRDASKRIDLSRADPRVVAGLARDAGFEAREARDIAARLARLRREGASRIEAEDLFPGDADPEAAACFKEHSVWRGGSIDLPGSTRQPLPPGANLLVEVSADGRSMSGEVGPNGTIVSLRPHGFHCFIG